MLKKRQSYNLAAQKMAFLPKFPQKPSRRRNRFAELASKVFVIVVLGVRV
jgi:hypothetical protein